MVGDDRVRFCCTCSKNVYDLSAMPAEDAEEFLAQHLGANAVANVAGRSMPCVKLYRRPDGRVLTSECPTGETRRHLRRFGWAVVAGAAGAALLAGAVDLATRPVLGPDMDEPELVETAWPSSRGLTMGLMTATSDHGDHGDESEDRYDVNAALRSDEANTTDVDPEGEGRARRRYVRVPDDQGIIHANVSLRRETL
jgi:hypothetical protein